MTRLWIIWKIVFSNLLFVGIYEMIYFVWMKHKITTHITFCQVWVCHVIVLFMSQNVLHTWTKSSWWFGMEHLMFTICSSLFFCFCPFCTLSRVCLCVCSNCSDLWGLGTGHTIEQWDSAGMYGYPDHSRWIRTHVHTNTRSPDAGRLLWMLTSPTGAVKYHF